MDWQSFFIGSLIGGVISWIVTRVSCEVRFGETVDHYLRARKASIESQELLITEQREHIEKLTVTNEKLRAQLHQLHTN